jgi:hypothetical protein
MLAALFQTPPATSTSTSTPPTRADVSAKALLFALVLLSLVGCAVQTAPPVAGVASPVVRVPSTADELILELGRLQALPPAQLLVERERAREHLERDGSASAQRHYVLTHLVAPVSPQDDERLLSMAERPDLVTDVSLRVLLAVARESAQARRKLREEIAAPKPRVAVARRDDREPEVRALKQRVEELEKQLAAIKSIEKSVARR